MEVAALPVSAKTGGMDLSAYDRKLGAAAKPLPIVKFIDEFLASFSIVASDGPIWTLDTDLNATRSKCGSSRDLSTRKFAKLGTICHACNQRNMQ
jgi:hypothetical protein